MEKIRNKFIILVFVLIALIIFVGIYSSFFVNSIDRNTYAVLIEGKGTINDELMIKESKELLVIGDVVKTMGNTSFIVVEWGDGSVTRLGPNSSVKINELYVEENLLQINLSFELLSGKSWSNVINFMGSKSYFKESFRDIEAGVRGTVFNIDLDNDYISVIKHKISLTGENIDDMIINENEPFSLKSLTFIKLVEFITKFKDSSFEKLNSEFDNELLKGLKEQVYENFESFVDFTNIDLTNLSSEKREELYNSLLTKYQELNFVNSDDMDLFAKKIEYKKALIDLADENEKINLLENTLYDFKESIKSKNYGNLDSILPILNNNKDLLDKIDFDFGKYFSKISINEDLKNAFGRNLDLLQNIFGSEFSISFPEVSFDGIKQKAGDLYNNSDVKNIVDEKIGFLEKVIKFLFNK